MANSILARGLFLSRNGASMSSHLDMLSEPAEQRVLHEDRILEVRDVARLHPVVQRSFFDRHKWHFNLPKFKWNAAVSHLTSAEVRDDRNSQYGHRDEQYVVAPAGN